MDQAADCKHLPTHGAGEGNIVPHPVLQQSEVVAVEISV